MFKGLKLTLSKYHAFKANEYFQCYDMSRGIFTIIPMWCVYGIIFGLPSVSWSVDSLWSPQVRQHINKHDDFTYGYDAAGDIDIWPSNLFLQFPFIKVTYRYHILWGIVWNAPRECIDIYTWLDTDVYRLTGLGHGSWCESQMAVRSSGLNACWS